MNVPVDGSTPHDIDTLEAVLKKRNIDGFVSGALRSDYQKSRLERMAQRLGMVSWTPLWHQSGEQHVGGMIEHGFEIMITGVSAEGLDQRWLGHVLTRESFQELKALAQRYRFHVEGEGGRIRNAGVVRTASRRTHGGRRDRSLGRCPWPFRNSLNRPCEQVQHIRQRSHRRRRRD